MTPPGDATIDELLKRHDQLLRDGQHAPAKRLLQDALIALYEESPISADVVRVLDALALGCKEVEQFQEAALYLSQSLAIKKLLLGPKNIDIVTAMRRLSFSLDPDRARVMRVKTKRLAQELGMTDHLDDFELNADDLAMLMTFSDGEVVDMQPGADEDQD